MKGRVVATHISDCDLDKEMHRLPGDGKINWEAVLSKLEEIEFDGVFMYEVNKPADREKAYMPKDVAKNYKEFILKVPN